MQSTAIVTGATGGIGLWIARGLARAGYRTVLVGRDAARGQAALDWIAHPEASLELADLSSLAETRALGRRLLARHPGVAVLVNNAGVFRARRQRTAEGHDVVLATNHLSPFVLTQALLPALRASAPSRIVTVGSDRSDAAAMDPANLALDRGWTMTRAYGRSKLAQMMTTFALAGRLRDTGITANIVHPGVVATGLVRTPGVIGLAWRLMALTSRTAEQGADTPLHVALAPELAGVTGAYFKDRRPVEPNRRARDPALLQAVWDATERLAGIAPSTAGPPKAGC